MCNIVNNHSIYTIVWDSEPTGNKIKILRDYVYLNLLNLPWEYEEPLHMLLILSAECHQV